MCTRLIGETLYLGMPFAEGQGAVKFPNMKLANSEALRIRNSSVYWVHQCPPSRASYPDITDVRLFRRVVENEVLDKVTDDD